MSHYVVLASWNSLRRPGWSRTHRSLSLCLPSAEIKGLHHYTCTYSVVFVSIYLRALVETCEVYVGFPGSVRQWKEATGKHSLRLRGEAIATVEFWKDNGIEVPTLNSQWITNVLDSNYLWQGMVDVWELWRRVWSLGPELSLQSLSINLSFIFPDFSYLLHMYLTATPQNFLLLRKEKMDPLSPLAS